MLTRLSDNLTPRRLKKTEQMIAAANITSHLALTKKPQSRNGKDVFPEVCIDVF